MPKVFRSGALYSHYAMAKYSQNQSCGHTCPWGSGDDNLPPDAFTQAAMKAARRRVPQETVNSQVQVQPETQPEKMDSVWSQTSRSVSGEKIQVQQDVEGKMMELLQKCLDKKVIELRDLKAPVKIAKDMDFDVRSSCSTATTRSQASSRQEKQPQKPQKPQQPTSKKTQSKKDLMDCSARDAEVNEVNGYEALDRYPALLREVNGLSDKAITQGLTSTGKQKQAMKLSDASLGKFDADQSRIAYLQMQKSAAEARNKNRSALTFGDDVGPFDKKTTKTTGPKEVTMAGKRAQAQKLSDASLGKFDVDQSQIAFRETHNSAAEMRNKNRVGQGIFWTFWTVLRNFRFWAFCIILSHFVDIFDIFCLVIFCDAKSGSRGLTEAFVSSTQLQCSFGFQRNLLWSPLYNAMLLAVSTPRQKDPRNKLRKIGWLSLV